MWTWKQRVSHCAFTLFSELFSNSLRMKAWMKKGAQHSNDDQKRCSFAADLNRIRNLCRKHWRRTKKTVPVKLLIKCLGIPEAIVILNCLLKMSDTSWPSEMMNVVMLSLQNIGALKLFSHEIDRKFPEESWWLSVCIYVKSLADSLISVLQYKDSKYS